MSSPHHQILEAQEPDVSRDIEISGTPFLVFDTWLLVVEIVEDTKQLRLVDSATHAAVDKKHWQKYSAAFHKSLDQDHDANHLRQMTKQKTELHRSYLIEGRHELVINYDEEDTGILHQFVEYCRNLASSSHAQGQTMSAGSTQGHHHKQASSHQAAESRTKLAYILVNLTHFDLYKNLMTEYLKSGHNHHIKMVPQLGPHCQDIDKQAFADYENLIKPALVHSRSLRLNHEDRRKNHYHRRIWKPQDKGQVKIYYLNQQTILALIKGWFHDSDPAKEGRHFFYLNRQCEELQALVARDLNTHHQLMEGEFIVQTDCHNTRGHVHELPEFLDFSKPPAIIYQVMTQQRKDKYLAQSLEAFSESGLQSRMHTLELEGYFFENLFMWLNNMKPGQFMELRVLNLRGADLREAQSEAFKGLKSLESLSLDQCGLSLTSGRTGALRPFWTDVLLPVSLRQLSLADNKLTSVVFDKLQNLINLETLSLKTNKITDIPNSDQILPKLAHVDITHNDEFIDFSGVTKFKEVKQLDCTKTNTADFLASFGWSTHETEIHSAWHHIEEFVYHALGDNTAPPNCIYLSNFTGLKVLDLASAHNVNFASDNEESHRPYRFSVMPHVHTLKLRNSTFEKADTALQGLKRKFPVLRHLDLHACKLRWTFLTFDSISNLDGLEDLNLSGNKLLQDHENKKTCSAEFYKSLSTHKTFKLVHLASCGLDDPTNKFTKKFKTLLHFVKDDPGAHSRHT